MITSGGFLREDKRVSHLASSHQECPSGSVLPKLVGIHICRFLNRLTITCSAVRDQDGLGYTFLYL